MNNTYFILFINFIMHHTFLLLLLLSCTNGQITQFTIFGERCSGTNYIQNIMKMNFELDITWQYGWKHHFGFNDFNDSDNTLFICIVREPYSWMNSFYQCKHHLPPELAMTPDHFLNNEFYSVNDNNDEIISDRNMYNGQRFKNIFELRHIKLKYMIETLPQLVKNYILIRYEDLLNDFDNVMNKIKKFDLPIIETINFPVNSKIDFKYGGYKQKKRFDNVISKDQIYDHSDFNDKFEKMLNYSKNDLVNA